MSILNLRLVDDAAKVHTYSSTQIAAALGVVSVASPFVTAVWTGIPDEVKALLPDTWRLAIAIAIGCLAIIAARYTTTTPKADTPAAPTASVTPEVVDADAAAAK